jgi:hypothetical protein
LGAFIGLDFFSGIFNDSDSQEVTLSDSRVLSFILGPTYGGKYPAIVSNIQKTNLLTRPFVAVQAFFVVLSA